MANDADDDPKPPDDAPRAERTAWNRRDHARRAQRLAESAGLRGGAAGCLGPGSEVLARAHAEAGKGARGRIRRAVKATVMAVLDPASGADVRDRLEAARLGASIGGLLKPPPVVVNVGFAVAFGAMGGRVEGEGEGAPPD